MLKLDGGVVNPQASAWAATFCKSVGVCLRGCESWTFGEEEADLVLIVSNQSLDDEEVRLRVTVDGVTVVDDDFHVEDQHNWISFPLSLPSGGHEVIADSDSGATLRESFEVPRNRTRYAIIEHWTEDDSADTDDASVDLTWQFQRKAPAFG